ncbi:nucleoside diphosphate kinase regulator [Cucumibacter marinus]|uniref:nucleoside diphosphate kinase regulator n=1 Tax=Cucumibacter marinus TaxID=1121252 RepID=UPI00056C03D0|nr:nucleoside diphosphate kinase regulator [Cucumibacter marinus]
MSRATATTRTLPPLVLNARDHDRLTTMANGITGPMADVAEQLLIELDRAEIVTPDRFPADAVGMGSIVSFKTTDGFDRTFQLVYPGEADINAGKVSVLTPIGAALIGLRAGQTIPWTARDGRHLRLTVLSVRLGE